MQYGAGLYVELLELRTNYQLFMALINFEDFNQELWERKVEMEPLDTLLTHKLCF